MGSFRSLADVGTTRHLMMSSSSMASIFAHDTLRRVHNTTIDCVYTVNSRKEFSNMVELSIMQPYTSDKWLFEIEYAKVRGLVKQNKGIFDSDTSCFMFIVDKYTDYKEVKELLGNINDIYTPFIRKDDVYFLFKGLELSDKVLSFVATSYSREPEKIFDLRDKMIQGTEVNTQRDVVKLIGASAGNINSFIMMLLSGKVNTAKGLKKVIRTRIQVGKDLCEAYGVKTFRNFLSSSLYDMIQIKMLYIHGDVYNDLRVLPDGFDEKKLSKYKYYFERIKSEFSYNDLVYLYSKLQEPENRVWRNESDMVRFIYSLYEEVVIDGAVG